MTGSLRISRDVTNKNYTSASIASRGSFDEPKSAGTRPSASSITSKGRFGSRMLWGNRRSQSDSMESSNISDLDGHSREKNVPFLQRLDNWVWLGYQNEFQL
jgi:hypothetical protein